MASTAAASAASSAAALLFITVTLSLVPADLSAAAAILNREVQKNASSGFVFGEDRDELVALAGQSNYRAPGDIIATGTPAGVGMGLNPPRYIAKGDVIRVEIDGVGHIENRFV